MHRLPILLFLFVGLFVSLTGHTPDTAKRFWQTRGNNYTLGTLDIIGRGTWGAKPPITEGRLWFDYDAPLCRHLRRITLHHTHSQYTIQSLQDFHQTLADPKADIAYHFFIDTDGKTYEARPLGYVGSHSEGDNTFNVGIVLNGDFQKKPPTLAQQKALNQLLQGLKQLCPGGYPEGLWTHRERKALKFPGQPAKQTACPGDHLHRLGQRLKQKYLLENIF